MAGEQEAKRKKKAEKPRSVIFQIADVPVFLSGHSATFHQSGWVSLGFARALIPASLFWRIVGRPKRGLLKVVS